MLAFRVIRFVFAVALLLSLAACGKSRPRADLVFINGAEPESIDPAIVTDQVGMRIASAMIRPHVVSFLDEMRDCEPLHPKANDRHILVGDLNVAPLEHDVWSHKQLVDVVSHTPVETKLLGEAQAALDWTDATRHFIPPDEKIYSWWSYRAKDPLGANKGRRLDHIWATPNLKNHIKSMKIYRDFRSENSPSDHVPIETEFEFLS